MSTTSQKGFTLIELLVVIAIIGTLASVVFAGVSEAQKKARDTNRITDVRAIQTALESHYSENGSYPATSWECSYESDWNTGTLATALDPYLETLPSDPVNESVQSYSGGKSYCYYASGYGRSGGWYMLLFRLEGQNNSFDSRDGSTTCNGNVFDYGGDDGYIITLGGDCVEA